MTSQALVSTVTRAARQRKRSALPLMISPPLLYLLLLYIVPVSIMAVYSLWDTDARGRLVAAWTWEQYAKVFTSVTVLKLLLRSFFMAFGVTALCIVLAFPVAYFIARIVPGRWKYVLLIWMIIPSWMSFLIRTYSWMIVLGEKGVLNYFGAKLGMPTVDILFSYPAVFIGLTHIYFPYMFLPIFASVDKLPESLLDAGDTLGAGTWQKFRRIIVPLTMPGIAAGCMLVFIPSLGEYVIPMILGGTQGMMYGSLIQSAFGTLNWPFGSAMAFFLLLIVLALFSLYSRFFKLQSIWTG